MQAITYSGKTALVTGASSGIGRALALGFAARGCNLVLVARSTEALQALAAEIHDMYPGSHTAVITQDLSLPGAAKALHANVESQKLQVDILVNNAGLGTYGRFHQIDEQREHTELMVDVVALTELCKQFVPSMVRRGSGVIVNVASMAGFQPIPYMASYGACKAYVISFSQALAYEYKQAGVHVLALCPGPTETPFFKVAGSGAGVFAKRRTVENVVATMFTALDKRRTVAIDGVRNRLTVLAGRFAPRSFVLAAVARQTKPDGASKN